MEFKLALTGEIIGRRRDNRSDACDPDGQPIRVHKYYGDRKAYRVLLKSMFRSGVEFLGLMIFRVQSS
jgi:hypothetical protein